MKLAYLVALSTLSSLALGVDTQVLETYVLATNRTDASTFFVPGTDEFYYYTLHRLIDSGDVNTSDFKTMLEFYASHTSSSDVQRLQLRTLLKRWDSATSEEDQHDLLTELNKDFLHWDLSAQRVTDTIVYPLLNVSLINDSVFYYYLSMADLSGAQGFVSRLALYLQTNQIYDKTALYQKMSLQQLLDLAVAAPQTASEVSWLDAILVKKFPISTQQRLTHADVQVLLEGAYDFMKSLTVRFWVYEKECIRRVLVLGLFTNTYQELTFLTYLELKQTYGMQIIEQRQFLDNIDQLMPSILNEEELVQEYADRLLVGKTSARDYDPFFEAAVLSGMIARANILVGADPSTFNVTPKFISDLAKTVELEFDRTNEELFSLVDSVALKVIRKNVPKLTITLIEVDAESYYRIHTSPIPTDLDFDGIVSENVTVLENTDSPMIKVTENITFPELDGKAGLFVVEVMGSGRHTRAWIRKGSLRYVSKPTVAGYMISIYSQEGVLQKTNHTGVILDGKMYERNGDKDYVLIPYAQITSTKTLVLVADNLVELVQNFTHEGEEYSLKAAFLLQHESLISDERASVLIKPSVYINQFTAPLAVLETISGRLSTTDFKGVVSSNVYPDLALDVNQATLTLDFVVPEGIKQLTVELIATVKQLNTGTITELQASNVFTANDLSYSYTIFDMYLRSYTDNTTQEIVYEIDVLGKNGEGIGNVVLDLTLESIYTTITETVTLSSDATGKINLGTLSDITKVQVQSRGQESVWHSWNLDSYRQRVWYPAAINLNTEDRLEIPISQTTLEVSPSMLSMSGDSVITTQVLDVDSNKSAVILENMSAGNYILKLTVQSEAVTVKLTVVQGMHIGKNFLLSDWNILPDTEAEHPIGIQSVDLQPTSITVNLNGAFEDAQVSVLLRNFHSNSAFQRWNMLTNLQGKSLDSFPAPDPRSEYLTSRLLDDEYRYILDRKSAKNRFGISYPLPSMLIKPKLVADTYTETQVPGEGTPFAPEPPMNPEYMSDGEGDTSGYWYTDAPGQYYEFLASPAVMIVRVSVNVTGTVEIQIPNLSEYGILEVIATTLKSVTQNIISLPDRAITKKSVTLDTAFDSSQKYAEIRIEKALRMADHMIVHNISSSKFAMIDSVEKLFRVLVQLGETEGTLGTDARDWMFLGKWSQMSPSEKKGSYDKFASHELNVFVYYKDKPFFLSVVQPLLIAKMEKTFIDDWLLELPLDQYLTLQKISQMPTLELALLAKRTNDLKIVSLLEDKKNANPSTVQHRRWLFDTVLQYALEGGYSPKLTQTQPQPTPEVAVGTMSDSAEGGPKLAPTAPAPAGEGMEDRGSYIPYFKQVDSTREYAETQYFGDTQEPASFEFWSVVAASSNSSVLTETVLEAHLTLSEVILATAITDLPWAPARQRLMSHGLGIELTIASNCFLLQKDILAVLEEVSEDIVLEQYYSEPSASSDQNHTTEFIAERVYVSKVIITNVYEKPVTLGVLVQVPQGSIPIATFGTEQTQSIELDQYTTNTIVSAFYFPAAGSYHHASAYVAVDGVVIRSSQAHILNVLEQPTTLNLDSFKDIARAGHVPAIINFLETKNLQDQNLAIDYRELHWLLPNVTVFEDITTTLRNRLVYVPSIWAYSLMHASVPELEELLQTDNSVLDLLGYYFTSSLVSTTRGKFRHLEYFPLVNARAHPLGNQPRIANQNFRESYDNFLLYLAEKQQLDVEDRLSLAQYFVLQSRYEEATEQVQAVDPNDFSDGFLLLQYDYLRAYLNTTAAKELVGKYENYPLLAWRDKFTEIADQLIEAAAISGPLNYTTPVLTASMSAGTLQIYSENLTSCLIQLLLVNLEVLFSRSPFVIEEIGSYAAPTYSETIPLVSGSFVNYTLPQSLIRENQLVELQYAGKVWSQLYLSSGLRIQTHTETGDLKVTGETYQALPGVYVKVYALNYQNVSAFYKDGYTDMRGRFNYATLSTDQLNSTTKFSILVADDTLGSTMLTVSPPPK